MADILVVECPWCKCNVEIEQLNCGIFRHGLDKSGNQLPPHSSEEYCKINNDTEKGCGFPFKIIDNIAIKTTFDS